MKIVFYGNHTVGVRSLSTLCDCAEIVGVVAHPEDAEDGFRYESVYAYALRRGLKVIRGEGKSAAVREFVSGVGADLFWIADYRYLLQSLLLAIPTLGVVNLHPSLLPKYRGRASINWAILNGEARLGLTAHFVDAGMDTGDIIEQTSFLLEPEQDVGDALNMYYPLYEDITRRVIYHFMCGTVPREVQNHAAATCFPARKPTDGLVVWTRSAVDIANLVRGVAKPYPGAFTYISGVRVIIWKVAIESEDCPCVPAKVVSVGPGKEFCVSSAKGLLRIKDWESPSGMIPNIQVGLELGRSL